MKYLLIVLIAFSLSCQSEKALVNPIDLFVAGTEGYACYRIPAIINTGKSILAFAEGRKNGCSDTGDIDLVLKRSTDNGRTWSALEVVWDAGDEVAGNPAPVFDKKTGTVFLLSTWNLGSDHESRIIDGTSKDTRRVFVLKSKDHGKSWSGAKEITSTTKLDNWTWYATGPVHGIQIINGKHKGRLVIPCDHIEAETKHYYSHTIYSDDSGETWKLGGTTPQHQVNECTVAEISNGQLVLNMRNYDRSKKTRKVSMSGDGGETWSDIFSHTALPEPICQAAMISQIPKKGMAVVYFTNPASTEGRKNMTIKTSKDDAMTWSSRQVLHSGPSAYSDICIIRKEKELGCLYEAGESSPYETIKFHLVKLD